MIPTIFYAVSTRWTALFVIVISALALVAGLEAYTQGWMI
jgi:hypothetical protein